MSRSATRSRPSAPLSLAGLLASTALLLALGAAFAPGSQASVARALDLSELVSRSRDIVVGETLRARSRRDGRRIVTESVVRVRERLQGPAGATMTTDQELVVTTLGGSVDGVGMRVEGAGRLAVGERQLLFLRAGAQPATLMPVGMAQGVLPIRQEQGVDMVHPGAHGLVLMRQVARGQLVAAPAALMEARPLRSLCDEIETLVAAGRAH